MGVSEALHLRNLLAWLGMPLKIIVRTDSSANRAMMSRLGVGKVRHLEVKTLWIQELIHARKIFVEKIKGEHNVADVGTKPLNKGQFEKIRLELGIHDEAAIEDEERVADSEQFGYHELSELTRLCSNKSFVQTLSILLKRARDNSF